MKLMILGLFSAFTFSAQALESYPIDSLSQLNYNGQTLDFAYTTGGGCQPHKAEVFVSLFQVSTYSYEARVTILDTTPAADLCDAIVPVRGSVDLKALVKESAQVAGVKSNYIDVVLPKVLVITD